MRKIIITTGMLVLAGALAAACGSSGPSANQQACQDYYQWEHAALSGLGGPALPAFRTLQNDAPNTADTQQVKLHQDMSKMIATVLASQGGSTTQQQDLGALLPVQLDCTALKYTNGS
jgi:hypothetical protein